MCLVFTGHVQLHAQLPVRTKQLILRSPSNGTITISPQTPQSAQYTLLLPSVAPTQDAVLQVLSMSGTTATMHWRVASNLDLVPVFEEAVFGQRNIRRRTQFLVSGIQGVPPPGEGAIDLQGERSSVLNTASGDYAGILAGKDNRATGSYGLVLGGNANQATGAFYPLVANGNQNVAGNSYSTVLNGFQNQVSGYSSAILGGSSNSISGQSSLIGIGDGNTITSDSSVILAGVGNRITSRASGILIGRRNVVSGDSSLIVSGSSNSVQARSSLILAGSSNSVLGNSSLLLGGNGLTIAGDNAAAWSGGSGSYRVNESQTFVVHNADVILARSTGASSKLTFVEPTTDNVYPSANTVSLRAGAMASNATYVLPTTLGAVGQVPRISSISGDEATLDWLSISSTLSGAPTQVAFFKTATELSSSSDVSWDTLNRTFTLINTSKPSELLSLSKSGSQTSNDTAMSILVTTTSTSTLTKRALLISSTGSWTGTNVGLAVTASGGTNNYAALFSSGRVGIGDDTPDATLDLDGDLAYTEYSFTGTWAAVTNNDVDFDGNDNRFVLVRVGTQSAARTITGFEGGVAGKTFNLINASGFPIFIEAQSTGSVAANRIITPDNDKVAIAHRSSAQFVYSGVDSRWYVTTTSPSNVVSFSPTDQTVAGAGAVLATSTSAYLRVSNNTANNQDVTVEDGVTVGQVVIVQNVPASTKNITLTGGNVDNVLATDKTLQPGQALILVWDGTDWQGAAAKGG